MVSGSSASGSPSIPGNFLALPPALSSLTRSKVALLPVPYDSTTSYKSGARDGPRAIIEASRELEDYDPELGCEPCRVGIYTCPELEPHVGSPKEMVGRVARAVRRLAARGKLVGVLGGEHSITIGAVQGLLPTYPDLSVLYLDAHADLRDSYMGSPYSHACTARRVLELCPLALVGVRSLSQEEHQLITDQRLPAFFWDTERVLDIPTIAKALSEHVYISIDLDVLDPSVMPAVGTPEPGGMLWHHVLAILRAIGRGRTIVGFDITELCPREGPSSCAFTAAKLTYKLVGYATLGR